MMHASVTCQTAPTAIQARTSKVTGMLTMLADATNRNVATVARARTSKVTEMLTMLRITMVVSITITTQHLSTCQSFLLSTTNTSLSKAHHPILSTTGPERPPKHQIQSRQMRRKGSPGRESSNSELYAGSPGRESSNSGLHAAPTRDPPSPPQPPDDPRLAPPPLRSCPPRCPREVLRHQTPGCQFQPFVHPPVNTTLYYSAR